MHKNKKRIQANRLTLNVSKFSLYHFEMNNAFVIYQLQIKYLNELAIDCVNKYFK